MGRVYPLLDHDPQEVPSLKSPTPTRRLILSERLDAEETLLPAERSKSNDKRSETAVQELDSDWELVTKCRAGHRQAFNLLVLRHKDRLYTLALHLLRDCNEAEDVAQETFVRAYERLGEFRGDAKFSSWLSCLCYDLCLTRLGKEKRDPHDPHDSGEETLPEILVDAVVRFPGQMIARKPQVLLPQALAHLDAEIHEVAVLSYVGQLSYEEIASLLALPVGAVRSRFHRGREELMEFLRPYLTEE